MLDVSRRDWCAAPSGLRTAGRVDGAGARSLSSLARPGKGAMTEHGSIARTRPRDGRRPVGAASSWATPV